MVLTIPNLHSMARKTMCTRMVGVICVCCTCLVATLSCQFLPAGEVLATCCFDEFVDTVEILLVDSLISEL